jgi:hypothetical protein
MSLVAAVAVSGCALVGSHGHGVATTAPVARPVAVRVTNNNLLDVDVYAIAHGEAMWLGQATSLNTTTFHLPDWFVNHGPMRLLVNPIGSGGHFFSDQVFVEEGQELDLMVAPADLALSNLSVMPAQSGGKGR